MHETTRRAAAICVLAALAGCTTYAAPINRNVTRPEGGPVPPGHMPPPGECRIWYPGQPPGRQPPPGNCQRLRTQVPPGAILVGPGRR